MLSFADHAASLAAMIEAARPLSALDLDSTPAVADLRCVHGALLSEDCIECPASNGWEVA